MAHEDLPQTQTSQTSAQLASSLVSAALESTPETPDAPVDAVPDYVDPLEVVQPVDTPPVEDAPVVDQPTPEPVTEEPVMEDVPLEMADEVYNELLTQGINVGVRKSELPKEMHAAYDKMLVGVVTQVQQVQQERGRAQEALQQIQGFADRLQSDPSQVLLTLALENKDAFAESVAQYERMQEDPEYEQLVRRETAAKAQMEAAKRQIAQAQQQALAQKAQQVRTLTQMHADALGVDPDIAERVVAAQVISTQGNISPAQIEATVRGIAPRAATMRTPAAQATHAQPQPAHGVETPAPAAPAEGAATPAEAQHVRSPLRSLIRNAAKRVDSGVRGG